LLSGRSGGNNRDQRGPLLRPTDRRSRDNRLRGELRKEQGGSGEARAHLDLWRREVSSQPPAMSTRPPQHCQTDRASARYSEARLKGRQHSEKDRAKPAPETCSLRRISHPTPHAGTEFGNPATVEGRDAALKKWATKNPCRPGSGWLAEPPPARKRQPALTATMDDAVAGPQPSAVEGNAAGMSEHEDAEPAEGELHRIQETQKQLMGKESPNTPVSMSHPAVPPGRHEWTETPIYHRRCGTLPQRHIIRLPRLSNTFGSQQSA
ncbi:hypothetical protein T08_2465, partial [Trichinella sp. T8]